MIETYGLDVRESLGEPRAVPLSEFPFTIGRSPASHLLLDDPLVSRHHAVIENADDGLTVTDLGSRNGVFLNGDRIRGERRIRPGDALQIGSTRLVVSAISTPAIPAAAAGSATVSFLAPSLAEHPLEMLSRGMATPVPEAVEDQRRRPDWDRLAGILVEPPSPELYEKVISAVEETVAFDRCFLLLFEEGTAEVSRVLARRSARGAARLEVLVSRDILRRVGESRHSVIVTRGSDAIEPSASFLMSGVWSALGIPLVARAAVSGVLYLERLLGKPGFTQDDIDALAPLAGIVGLKIENRQLFEAYLAAEIDKRDMEIAEAVQQKYFPGQPVRIPGYSVETFVRSCRQVGGDCLDSVMAPDRRTLTLVVGDVSGKGLPSALYMVGVLSTLRAHLLDGIELDLLMERLDRYVRARFRTDHFLTLFVGRLDAQRHVLTYASAGHVPPIAVSPAGEASELEVSDPALNVVPWSRFRLFEHPIAPGEVLLIYTDGISEAMNAREEQFGKERLVAGLLSKPGADVYALRQEILSRLEEFVGHGKFSDDVSLILVKRDDAAWLPEPPPPWRRAREILSARVKTSVAEKERLIDEILQALEGAGFSTDAYFDRLCLDEAITNAMVHGNRSDPSRSVAVRVGAARRGWLVEIEDEGGGFDWPALRRELERGALDPARPSARGLEFILASGAEVDFLDGGRRMRIARRTDRL
ncbi:MAG: SpoIIE family protein phosphatase [Planctomycetes bacterium]|nr:SpoIIE family protein phosphatase [Planctomycetota bacterium]